MAEKRQIILSYDGRDERSIGPLFSLLKAEGYEVNAAASLPQTPEDTGLLFLFAASKHSAENGALRKLLESAEKRGIPVRAILADDVTLPDDLQRILFVHQVLKLKDYRTYGEFCDRLSPLLKDFAPEEPEKDLQEAQKLRRKRIPGSGEKTKKGRFVWLAAAILLLAALAVIGNRYLLGEIPDVVGMDMEAGAQAVYDAGFSVNRTRVYSDRYEYGIVAEQSRKGLFLRFIPVVLSESLGIEDDLVTVPDVLTDPVAEAIGKVVEAGMKRFTVIPDEGESEAADSETDLRSGTVIAQSIPGGLSVSALNRLKLTAALRGDEELEVTIGGETVRISGDACTVFDVTSGEVSYIGAGNWLDGMTDAEWELFLANNRHEVWPETQEEFGSRVWLPAISQEVITENPDACYGWVAVRDMSIDAEELFGGFSELYVCPGITVTVTGGLDTGERGIDGFSDWYVAPGGRLVFEEDVYGGVNLCNDGETVFMGSFDSGDTEYLWMNRGTVSAVSFKGAMNFYTFGGSAVTGEDMTDRGIQSYDHVPEYVGHTGMNGMWIYQAMLEEE